MRNLVWDYLYLAGQSTPLTDVDVLIFYDLDVSTQLEYELEDALCQQLPEVPWSVRNQARMHHQHGHLPYQSIAEAMTYWPEIETAIGVTLNAKEELSWVAQWGISALMAGTITKNCQANAGAFEKRLNQKQWLQKWPGLRLGD